MDNKELELRALSASWSGPILRIAVKYGNGEVVENFLTTHQAKQVAKVVLEREIEAAKAALERKP